MPMLKIWTPPPDMYSMNACMGRDFAGPIATSQARFSFRASSDAAVAVGFAFDWEESLVAEICCCYRSIHLQLMMLP